MIQLIITDPTGQQKKQIVNDGSYSIGRGILSDFRVADKSVGRRQLEINVNQGSCSIQGERLTDTFDFNGINTQKIDKLIEDDLIEFGKTRIQILRHSANRTIKDDALSDDAAMSLNTAEAEVVQVEEAIQKEELVDEKLAETSAIKADSGGYKQRVSIRREIQNHVQKQLDLYQREKLTGLENTELRAEATRLADEVIRKRLVELPDGVDKQAIVAEVVSESIGLGPLEPLLSDSDVTEVMVNGPTQVYVEKSGKIEETGIQFINDRSLMAIIERIVSPLGRRIDEGSPLVDARLADGSRVNAIIPPLSLIGPTLTIRKFSDKRLYMDSLVQMGALSEKMARFLELCVEQRKNIVISGGTGSGKTTFLNALSDAIPEEERIVTIEDAAELKLNQKHVISLEARPANVEGRGLVSIRDLVRNSLRMRPDRIIVGECRDGAALDMLQAMNTGHDGSMTTGHANSPRDLLSRLEVMCLMSDIDLPSRALREQISSAVDIIVQQSRFKDGTRRITSIVEVDGLESDVILLNTLFEYRQTGVNLDGKVIGEHTGLNRVPQFYGELEKAGFRPDRSLFAETKDSLESDAFPVLSNQMEEIQ